MTTDVTGAAPLGLLTGAQLATGSFTSDGNPVSVTIGSMPRDMLVVNETDGIVWRRIQGMAPANSIKNGALDTTGAIAFPTDPGLNEPGNTVLLSAAVCGTGKKISWACYC